MASTLAVALPPCEQKLLRGGCAEEEEDEDVERLRRRNEALEAELRKSIEREEEARKELRNTRKRLVASEEVEVRLSSQIEELKTDSAYRARAYHARLKQLAWAQSNLALDIIQAMGI